MQFLQVEFFALLTIIFIGIRCSKSLNVKKIILILGSIYFYSYLNLIMLTVIGASIIITFIIGKLLGIYESSRYRKQILITGVVVNLISLGIFKYYGFFAEIVTAAFSHSSPDNINLILPIGISFYTFRFISYLVDVFRNEYPPASFIDFSLYGLFFPIILAGPISRAKQFLPQLSELESTWSDVGEGIKLFVTGMFLKVFIADRIGYYVDYFFENYSVFDMLTTWVVMFSYSIQIYCDFAGYSSMAIGISLLLTIRIEKNFDFPYISRNISEFWSRWHITLSTWIRDYLYIPLGGSRKGSTRTTLNLMLAMTLCGLWHGAAFTFIIWGAIHGVFLIIYHKWKQLVTDSKKGLFFFQSHVLSWLLTFVAISMSWIFFRADTLEQAFGILQKLFTFHDGVTWISPFALLAIGLVITVHLLKLFNAEIVRLSGKQFFTPAVVILMALLVVVFYPTEFQPFVYAQF